MITRKLGIFFKMSAGEKLTFAEAYAMLVLVKLILQLFSFKQLIKHFGSMQEQPLPMLPAAAALKAKKVKKAILIAAKNLPWESVCLDQALATARMLSRRNISHSLYLGIKKNDEHTKIMAHAWVVCGGVILIGGEHSREYMTVAAFSKIFSDKGGQLSSQR